MFCPNCGNQIKKGEQFCFNCGYEISSFIRKNAKKKCFILAGVLIMISVTLSVIFVLNRNNSYNEQISSGDIYMQEMDYDHAELAYSEAIRIDSKNQKGYTKLVQLYMKTKEWEKAEDVIEKASEIIKKTDELDEYDKIVKLNLINQRRKSLEIYSVPVLEVNKERDVVYSEDGEKELVHGEYIDMSLISENKELEKTFIQWKKEEKDLWNTALTEVKMTIEQVDYSNAWLSHSVEVKRLDGCIVSFLERMVSDMYEYGYRVNEYYGINIDATTGQLLKLEDVIKDKNQYIECTCQYGMEVIKQYYNEEELTEDDRQEILENMLCEPDAWYLDATGLGIILKMGLVDTVDIHIPYIELVGNINENYIWAGNYGVASISENQSVYVDVDGELQEVSIQKEGEEYSVGLNDVTTFWGEYNFLEAAYVMNYGNVQYILASAFGEDNESNSITNLYKIEYGELVLKDTMDAEIDTASVDLDSFDLQLTTWKIIPYVENRKYYIDENDLFKTNENAYEVYAEIIRKYENQYGKARVYDNGGDQYMTGLCFAKLVDFAGDGQEELLMVYSEGFQEGIPQNYISEVWGLKDNKVDILYSGDICFTDGGYEYISLLKEEKKSYLCSEGSGDMCYGFNEQQQFSVVRMVVTRMTQSGNWIYEINGKEFSPEEFVQEQETWLSHYKKTEYWLSNSRLDTDVIFNEIEETKLQLGIIIKFSTGFSEEQTKEIENICLNVLDLPNTPTKDYPDYYYSSDTFSVGINNNADSQYYEIYWFVENKGMENVYLEEIRIGMRIEQAEKILLDRYPIYREGFYYNFGCDRIWLYEQDGVITGYRYEIAPTG